MAWLFKDVIWKGEEVGNYCYLSFDDGPHPDSTPEIMSILRKEKVKASFFCQGKLVEKYPELVKKLEEEGHCVGNHGYEHIMGWRCSTMRYMRNIETGHRLIPTKLFRPPYGKITLRQYLRIRKKHKIIMWTIMPGDFDQKQSPEKMLKTIKKYFEPGTIVVLHDKPGTLQKTAPLLELIFQWAKEEEILFKKI